MNLKYIVFVFSFLVAQNTKLTQSTISSGFVSTSRLNGTLGQSFTDKYNSDNLILSTGFWGGIQSRYYDERQNKCKAHSKGFDMWYVRTIITILFPPMGVFMAKGLFGMPQILLSCVLTMLLYFPGLIYSFAVISSSKIDIEQTIGLKKNNKK